MHLRTLSYRQGVRKGPVTFCSRNVDSHSVSHRPWGIDDRFQVKTGGNDMMRITTLTLTSFTLMCLAVALPAKDLLAQQRLVFKVAAENTKYTQQHTIDVGDVSGHQVRLFEIHRTYPSNAPVINGMKMMESWTRGIPDYTNNNAKATS